MAWFPLTLGLAMDLGLAFGFGFDRISSKGVTACVLFFPLTGLIWFATGVALVKIDAFRVPHKAD